MEAAFTTDSTNHRQPIPRMAVSVPEAAASLGLSIRSTWTLVSTGRLRSIRAGRRVLVPTAALGEFIAADLRPIHSSEPQHAD
jgi:excisionase family DNA binding protein